MSGAALTFWAAVALLAYTYFGYPALIWAWAKIRPWPSRDARVEPMLTILVVACNEAERIEARLENLLALDYPPARLQIMIASDGSSDDTAARARRFRDQGVDVFEFGDRRGKPAVLNELVPRARGEIVLLADARQRFHSGALRGLVNCFADPRVGAVSGELILTTGEETNGVGEGVGFYWKYEKFIRRQESRVDSMAGVTGAIYAIRRDLFAPIPPDTLIDDVLIPMRVVKRGYRVLFEPCALAYDQVSKTSQAEFTRKVRTIAGNFQLFVREPWLLNPFANRIWLQTLSHKGCRLLSPFCLGAALGANLLLLNQPFYLATAVLQALFYAAAFGGFRSRRQSKKRSIFNLPYAFCLLNWAALVAFIRFVSGRQRVTWERAS